MGTTIFEQLLIIFENDSKVLSLINSANRQGKSDIELITKVLKTRPTNVKVKQMIQSNEIILSDTNVGPINAEIKHKEVKDIIEPTNEIPTAEDLKNRMIQEFLDRNGYKEIPKFEGMRPLNREAVIVKGRIDGIKEEEKKKRLSEWEELEESNKLNESKGFEDDIEFQ
jgi:hypothetical protein